MKMFGFSTFFIRQLVFLGALILPGFCSSPFAPQLSEQLASGMQVVGDVVSDISAKVADKAKAAVQDGAALAAKKIQERRLSELTKLAESQWVDDFHSDHLVSRMNMTDQEKPSFIVVFFHGYRPGFPGWKYALGRQQHILAPFLKDFKYLAYHPTLGVGPALTTFAQDHDVFQVKFHIDKVLELVKNADSECFGLPVLCVGHSNGAATLLATFGAHPELAQKVKGLVLFAPYSDVRNALFLGREKYQAIGDRVRNTMPIISGIGYKKDKLAPIDYIKNGSFPYRFPFFLIHCKDDPHVTFDANFLPLQSAFRAMGYGLGAHFHPFEKGRHGSFSKKSSRDDRKALKKDLGDFIRKKVVAESSEEDADAHLLAPDIIN